MTTAALVTTPAVDLIPCGDRLLVREAAVIGLADAAQDEHVVVHREPEQDHEQEHRQPRRDAAVRAEVRAGSRPSPTGRSRRGSPYAAADGEQVEEDRLDRDHDRAERDQQDQEGEDAGRSRRRAAPTSSSLRSSPGRRGRAGDRVLDAVDLAERVRQQLVRAGLRAPPARRRPCRCRRAGCPRSRPCCRGLPRPRSGRFIWPVASAFRLRSAIAFWTGSARTSSALIATVAGSLPPGKASSNFFIGSISGIEMSSMPVVAVLSVNAGTGEGDEHGAGGDGRDDRAPEDAVEDCAPEAALAVLAAEPVHERDAALLDPVAELAESSAGQHGQRAEHRDRDDHHRPDREGHERLVAGEEHAGHRDQDGDAGDEDGAAGGGCGGLEGSALAPSGRTLFALAPEVEERVVDADRKADQQDDFGDRLVDRDELAGQCDQSRRRHDRGDREQQRDRARRRRSRTRAAG